MLIFFSRTEMVRDINQNLMTSIPFSDVFFIKAKV